MRKLFNACIRFAFGLRRTAELSSYRDKILGCGIIEYLEMRALLFLHKVILTRTPNYISQKIEPGISNRTRSFIVPYASLAKTHKSLLFMGIVRYNSLPVDVKGERTVGGFKRSYIDYIRRGA